MNMHYGWIVKSVVIGLIVMLAICYLFSIAFSINQHEAQMMNKLSQYNDTTFEHLRGSGDAAWLAALGSLVTLFAGGMAAVLLSRPDKPSTGSWLLSAAVVAVITILVIDGYMLISWNDSVQKWYKNPVDELGRPYEPIFLPMLIFLILMVDMACFLASAAGGFIARGKREMLIFETSHT
jgi:glucan phosphoethanolaminetransferase (alkaline phosphatase superfamily)